jgi:hypothetical protein
MPLSFLRQQSPFSATTPQHLRAYCRTRGTIGVIIHEQWKVEAAPSQRIAPGMHIQLRNEEHGMGTEFVTLREGTVGKRVYLEKRWAAFELEMEGMSSLSVTMLVPLEWFKLSWADTFSYYRQRLTLPDITPGPFPFYEQGAPRVDRYWM